MLMEGVICSMQNLYRGYFISYEEHGVQVISVEIISKQVLTVYKCGGATV